MSVNMMINNNKMDLMNSVDSDDAIWLEGGNTECGVGTATEEYDRVKQIVEVVGISRGDGEYSLLPCVCGLQNIWGVQYIPCDC
jgi:hypothetical protein